MLSSQIYHTGTVIFNSSSVIQPVFEEEPTDVGPLAAACNATKGYKEKQQGCIQAHIPSCRTPSHSCWYACICCTGQTGPK